MPLVKCCVSSLGLHRFPGGPKVRLCDEEALPTPGAETDPSRNAKNWAGGVCSRQFTGSSAEIHQSNGKDVLFCQQKCAATQTKRPNSRRKFCRSLVLSCPGRLQLQRQRAISRKQMKGSNAGVQRSNEENGAMPSNQLKKGVWRLRKRQKTPGQKIQSPVLLSRPELTIRLAVSGASGPAGVQPCRPSALSRPSLSGPGLVAINSLPLRAELTL